MGGCKCLITKIIDKFRQLIVPFCVWGIIWSITSSKEPYCIIFKEPDRSLWFLWVLFIIYINYLTLLYFTKTMKCGIIYRCLGLFIVLLFFNKTIGPNFGIGYALGFSLYFIVGIVIRASSKILDILTTKPILTILGVASTCCSFLWFRDSAYISFDSETVNSIVAKINDKTLYRQFTAFSSSVFFIALFYYFVKRISDSVAWIGRNTLAIYATHQTVIWLLMNILPDTIVECLHNTVLGNITTLIFVVAITLVLIIGFRHNKILKLLFLGEK